MPALSFCMFRDKIESGAKHQTIRGVRKNPIKSGDRLFMYWKQRSPKNCEKLGEATCKAVTKVVIEDTGYLLFNPPENRQELNKNDFAIADGFDNWQKLIEFFESAHGLPFEGVLIEWDSIKSPF